MSERYKVYNSNAPHFVTTTVIDWVDLLIRNDYRNIIIDSLTYCQENKGLNVHAYVIMTSHLHLIISKNGEYDLPAILRDFKKFTSKVRLYSL